MVRILLLSLWILLGITAVWLIRDDKSYVLMFIVSCDLVAGLIKLYEEIKIVREKK